MSKQRIYSKRLYIVGIPQGISGFRKPAIPAIVTGLRHRTHQVYEPTWSGQLPAPVSAATFRMEDGHLPECQPRGDIEAVTTFLAANPYAAAYWC